MGATWGTLGSHVADGLVGLDVLDRTPRGSRARSRNALAHGNPVARPTIASIRELSRYRTDVALDAAMTAHVGQRPLKDLLCERAAAHKRTGRSLADGISLYQQWQQQDTSANSR